MEINGPSRFRNPKSQSTDRFLGVYPHAPPSNHLSHSSAVIEELNEDDIFSSADFSDNSNGSSSAGGLSHFTTKKHLLPPLPLTINPSLTPKTSESSPPSATLHVRNPISTKSPRFLLRPPLPPLSLQHLPLLVQFLRFRNRRKNESPFHQSAPVNVPMLAKPMRKKQDFDDDYDMELEEEGEMLPPHEIVAKSLAQSPMLACSVLEGVGRTLKGRDLRQFFLVI
ncbi:hypothetical protein GOBAR_AA26933 [Gossypium barbadense]|uniref:Uncharacterized protein n=1 Tax=Gossypium barbadense TaxID=3634 RepID=A0A2P5WRK8_GOSBA|nr:hypothetical protein GOBAR_AA26933 [Gossypium barbadense]